MAESIAVITLLTSAIGIGVIVFRKIPVLVNLPEVVSKKDKKSLISELKKGIKKINPFKNFSYEIFLQKILSKVRILTLKADSQTFNWLQKLREKTKKKKLENGNYWEELKKIKKEK